MRESPDSKAISNDISEMEEMIDGYIAFAAGEVMKPARHSYQVMVKRLVTQARKSHKFDITLSPVKMKFRRSQCVEMLFSVHFQT